MDNKNQRVLTLAMHLDRPSPVGGYVDTKQGILYRRPQDKTETKKRQRPTRLPSRYLAYLRKQSLNGRRYVVERQIERNGEIQREMIKDIRKAWSNARILAVDLAAKRGVSLSLSDVTPHTLKHTAITWAMQRGGDHLGCCRILLDQRPNYRKGLRPPLP